jgi:hypothetical protein
MPENRRINYLHRSGKPFLLKQILSSLVRTCTKMMNEKMDLCNLIFLYFLDHASNKTPYIRQDFPTDFPTVQTDGEDNNTYQSMT